MRIATWNINSAHILSESGKYDREDLRYIVDTLKGVGADVVCLQEVAVPETGLAMADRIAMALGMFVETYSMMPNHVTGKGSLALAILSKGPILQSSVKPIRVAPLNATFTDGTPVKDIDRAFLETSLVCDEGEITVITGHMNPFHAFGLDAFDPRFRGTRDAIQTYLLSHRQRPTIVAGDMNCNALDRYLSLLFEKDFVDVLPNEPTHAKRPDKLDAIICTPAWKKIDARIEQRNTDHALCWADVELKK